jgi:succinyl-CoA--D-citramalate CoA-transferase
MSGCRVLELCSTIAGPACTRLLADFGADVIKVEPRDGDPVRKYGVPDRGVDLYASSILRNKRSVVVDLKQPRGVELVLALAEKSDVLVENFRPGTLERLGLGYDVLSARNPRLVLVRISGYGQTGPYRHKAGYGAICEAFGGVRELTGEPDRPPVRVAVPVTDYMAAAYAAFGAAMALRERDRSGKGQVVDVALYEAAFAMLESIVPGHDRFGYVPTREGSRLPFMAPNNLYLAKDGSYLLIAAANDAVFRRLVTVMGRDELAADPRFATIAARWQHVDEVDALVGEWVAMHGGRDAEAKLDAAGVPASRVFTVRDIFDDPHYAAREMLPRVPHPVLGAVAQTGIVPKLSDTPGAVRWAGHELGADTREVLSNLLGLPDSEIDELIRSGVVTARADAAVDAGAMRGAV